MTEFASPTINRKDALTEDPYPQFINPASLWSFYEPPRTHNSTNLSNATDLIGYISADGDRHILYM